MRAQPYEIPGNMRPASEWIRALLKRTRQTWLPSEENIIAGQLGVGRVKDPGCSLPAGGRRIRHPEARRRDADQPLCSGGGRPAGY